jgi:hypothetical protein
VHRNSSLDDLIRENDEWRGPLSENEDIGEALRDAIIATRAKIDQAFANRPKIAARLKQPI